MRPHRPVPRIELIRAFALRLSNLGGNDAGRDRAGDAPGNLVLHGKDIGKLAVVAVGPQMVPACRFDQLCGDAHAVAGPPHAAFEHITHP